MSHEYTAISESDSEFQLSWRVHRSLERALLSSKQQYLKRRISAPTPESRLQCEWQNRIEDDGNFKSEPVTISHIANDNNAANDHESFASVSRPRTINDSIRTSAILSDTLTLRLPSPDTVVHRRQSSELSPSVWSRERKQVGIPPLIFDQSSKQWVPIPRISSSATKTIDDCKTTVFYQQSPSQLQASVSQQCSSRLRTITYNCNFDSRRFYVLRLKHIFNQLEASQADVIALQEATPELIIRLATQPWVRKSYIMSDATGDSMSEKNYGQLMLCRRESWTPTIFRIWQLPTRMGRSLMLAEFASHKLVVGTVHLDSLQSSRAMRRVQMRHVTSILDQLVHKDTILMGDFNAGEDDDELRLNAHEFIDCWTTLLRRSVVEGCTMEAIPPFTSGWRPDRVLLRREALKRVQVIDMELFGREPLVLPKASRRNPHSSNNQLPSRATSAAAFSPVRTRSIPGINDKWVPKRASDHLGIQAQFTVMPHNL